MITPRSWIILTLLSVLLIQLTLQTSNVKQYNSEENAKMEEWIKFKKTYGKSYNAKKEETRKEIFLTNLEYIKRHNKNNKEYTLGINEYSDMSQHEINHIMNGFKMDRSRDGMSTYLSPLGNLNLPKSVDWREHGYVTEVKNQGQCGSCWAFSSTGSLEGQHFRSTGELVSLSEQQLVDCAEKFGPHGCGGGWMKDAFRYIKDNGGVDTEECYRYTAKDGKCQYKSSCIGGKVSGYVAIPEGSEEKLKEAVATQGPVSVAIDASFSSFSNYKSGIYNETSCSTTAVDHAVLVVGYGTEESGKDYWIVKNSWGTSWGINGYIKMSRNQDNQCGIASYAIFPLV